MIKIILPKFIHLTKINKICGRRVEVEHFLCLYLSTANYTFHCLTFLQQLCSDTLEYIWCYLSLKTASEAGLPAQSPTLASQAVNLWYALSVSTAYSTGAFWPIHFCRVNGQRFWTLVLDPWLSIETSYCILFQNLRDRALQREGKSPLLICLYHACLIVLNLYNSMSIYALKNFLYVYTFN